MAFMSKVFSKNVRSAAGPPAGAACRFSIRVLTSAEPVFQSLRVIRL